MRIAIATVGTTGDVAPFVVLARELVRRGHDVTAVSWALHGRAFEDAGVRFAPAGPPITEDEIARVAGAAAAERSPLAQVGILRRLHLRDAGRHYSALREVLTGHELVLLHGIHGIAEAAARDARLPYATAVFDPVLLPTATAPPAGMPSLGPLNPLLWRLLDRAMRAEDRALAAELREAGSGSAGDHLRLFRARSRLLHLVAVSPVLAPPPRDLARHVHFTEAWFDPTPVGPLASEIETFLSDDPPPVLVTFGSMSDPGGRLGRLVLAAARETALRVILQDGGADPVRGSTAADGTLRVGRIDHRALMPRTAGVVHHGGAGTTHAAARAGIPQLVVPHVGDQRFWGERVRRLGLGPTPLHARAATRAKVAKRVAQLGDDGYRAAAQSLADQMRAEDGCGKAIRLIEQLA